MVILAFLSLAWASPAAPASVPTCRFEVPDVRAAILGSPSPRVTDGCVRVGLDLAGRGSVTLPREGIWARLELARAHLGLDASVGPVRARAAFTAVRSGPPAGYLGIDGEAIVPKVETLEVRGDWTRAGLAVAGGVVDDLWTMSSEPRWALRSVAPTMAESRGLAVRSDLGAWLSWTSPKGWTSLSLSLTSGEGADLRERNNGKDVAGLLVVHPLAGLGHTDLFELALYAREGSRGVERARDHRVGGRADVVTDMAAGGVEVMHGWGLDGDPLRVPTDLSLWARTGDALPVSAWARVDVGWLGSRPAETLATTWRLGGGPTLPWRGMARRVAPLSILVGYEGLSLAPGARPLAGAASGAIAHSVWLQLGVRIDARARVHLFGVQDATSEE